MDNKSLVKEIYNIAEKTITVDYIIDGNFPKKMLEIVFDILLPSESINYLAPFVDTSFGKMNYGIMLTTDERLVFVERSFGSPWVVHYDYSEMSSMTMDNDCLAIRTKSGELTFDALDKTRCKNLYKIAKKHVP